MIVVFVDVVCLRRNTNLVMPHSQASEVEVAQVVIYVVEVYYDSVDQIDEVVVNN